MKLIDLEKEKSNLGKQNFHLLNQCIYWFKEQVTSIVPGGIIFEFNA